MELSQQAFGSPALMEQLARMDANLQALRPGEDWGGSEQFEGEEGLGLGDGTGVLQDLAELDQLADQLSQSYDGARLDDVDLDALARQLGDDAAVDARTLQALERALRDSGYLTAAPTASTGSARRRCGSSARRCCATSPSGCRAGRGSASCARPAPPATCRARPASGSSATPSRGTSPAASATRYAGPSARARDPRGGVRLDIGDVEVQETEARTQAAVALLVDTSFSMAMDGRWVPMKRTALALHT